MFLCSMVDTYLVMFNIYLCSVVMNTNLQSTTLSSYNTSLLNECVHHCMFLKYGENTRLVVRILGQWCYTPTPREQISHENFSRSSWGVSFQIFSSKHFSFFLATLFRWYLCALFICRLTWSPYFVSTFLLTYFF